LHKPCAIGRGGDHAGEQQQKRQAILPEEFSHPGFLYAGIGEIAIIPALTATESQNSKAVGPELFGEGEARVKAEDKRPCEEPFSGLFLKKKPLEGTPS
jgi:hypothetical protein